MVNPVLAGGMVDDESDNLKLRRAIHKLKVENSRMKSKLKTLTTTVQQLVQVSGIEGIKNMATEAEKDYEELGSDYILVGGPKDPLGMRYDILIKDDNGIEHKSGERYYWYKMAEFFGDTASMEKILNAKTGTEAETAKKTIKGFNERKWDEVKLKFWEEAMTKKLEQHRWISNLLVATETTYIAVASQDKKIGIGWRKNREESTRKMMWDGENNGGKFLMNYRQTLKADHKWENPSEQTEANNKVKDLRMTAWRRNDPTRERMGGSRIGGRGRGRLSGGEGRGRGRARGGGERTRTGRGRGGAFPRKGRVVETEVWAESSRAPAAYGYYEEEMVQAAPLFREELPRGGGGRYAYDAYDPNGRYGHYRM